MANKGLLKVSANQSFLGFTRSFLGSGTGADLMGAASMINSSLQGLILEITMKPGEIDMRFKAFHL